MCAFPTICTMNICNFLDVCMERERERLCVRGRWMCTYTSISSWMCAHFHIHLFQEYASSSWQIHVYISTNLYHEYVRIYTSICFKNMRASSWQKRVYISTYLYHECVRIYISICFNNMLASSWHIQIYLCIYLYHECVRIYISFVFKICMRVRGRSIYTYTPICTMHVCIFIVYLFQEYACEFVADPCTHIHALVFWTCVHIHLFVSWVYVNFYVYVQAVLEAREFVAGVRILFHPYPVRDL